MINKKTIIILSVMTFTGLLVACGGAETKLDLMAGIRSENVSHSGISNESDVLSEENSGDDYVIPEMEGTSIVSISKKGKVTNTILQNFDEDYYDQDSLETFVKAEISDYNREQGKDAIELKSVKVDDEAQVILVFDNPSYFADFNSQTFFYGTIEEAMLEDYNLNVDYIDIKSGDTVDVDVALDKEKRHIVISRSDRDRLNIEVPKDILYVSNSVSYDKKKKKEALAAQGEFNVIITK